MNRRVDRFDIPARLAALRELVGADADAIDMAEWAVRCLGDRCLRFEPALDPARDPLLQLEDRRFVILLDRSTPLSFSRDIAFGVARWWLRDLADDQDFARTVSELADAICPPLESKTRLRVTAHHVFISWSSTETQTG